MWGILERNKNKKNQLKRRKIKKKKKKKHKKRKKSGTVKTYSIEQLSVLHKVGMSAEEAWDAWRLNGAKRFFPWPQKDKISLLRWNIAAVWRESRTVRRRRCSALPPQSLLQSSIQRLCVRGGGGRIHTLHVHFLASFCSSLYVRRAKTSLYNSLNWAPPTNPPDAMQGERFEVLLICFFLVCFQKTKVLQLQVLCLT